MARTPLFRRFVVAMRLLRDARAGGPSALERAQARRERRPDARRRALLKGAAGGALALPLLGASGCGRAALRVPVAIIGGGMAGLHAAYRLKTRGLDATVFEASRRVGGRMMTDRATFAAQSGQHAELGGELIDTPHLTMRDLAAELDVALVDYAADEPGLVEDTVFLDGAIVSEATLLEGFAPIAEAIDLAWADARDPEAAPSYLDDNGLAALDQLSITAWLDGIGASGPVRELLEIAYTIEFGLEASEQSALNLLTLVGTETDALVLFGESDERFTSAVGNDALTSRLAAALDPNQVALEHRLVRITARPDGSYALAFDHPGGARDVIAERVVLTLPFTMLREVELVGLAWPAQKARAIAELGYGTNTKLMVGFASRPWRALGARGGSYSDLGYQATWETSRMQPGPEGILTNFTGGQRGLELGDGSAGRQADTFLEQIDQVFPGTAAAANGAVARFAWASHAYTRGSYSAYRVGQWTAFSGAEIERVDNLLFAGEHTSVDAQGYMEGAALTGAMAAEAIAVDLALPEAGSAAALSLPAHRIAARARVALREGSWIRAASRAASERLSCRPPARR